MKRKVRSFLIGSGMMTGIIVASAGYTWAVERYGVIAVIALFIILIVGSGMFAVYLDS